jgi:hypothetical protein
LEQVEEFVNAFPDRREDFRMLIRDYAMGNKSALMFERAIKRTYTEILRKHILNLKCVFKGKNLRLAYLDVARYHTDVIDAAIEWEIDEDVLYYVLELAPPPPTTEGRLSLEIPVELRKLRECL